MLRKTVQIKKENINQMKAFRYFRKNKMDIAKGEKRK